MTVRIVSWLLLVLSLAFHGWALSAEPVESRVDSFAPQGTVKTVRQVTARFALAMARFGDLRLAAPFDIDCPFKGSGRWVDGRVWVFDFEQDLPAGVRCSFKLKPNIKALSGAPVLGQNQFSFDTGGPSIIDTLPDEDSQNIDENPLFILKLDAPAVSTSIVEHARCEIDGMAERIELNVMQGEERNTLLSGPIRKQYDYFFENVPDKRLLVVQCRRNFPPTAKVRLVWGGRHCF